jgi:N-methylhydantoinase A
LDANEFLGGGFRLDITRLQAEMDSHRGTLATTEAFAEGILRVVESAMEKAIRLVSIERGHDPREFTLVAFGGAGPLHACALARLLRIPRVLVPALPGALSALGILFADQVRDYSRTIMLQVNDSASEQLVLDELAQLQEIATIAPNVLLQPTADLRYQGQGYELNIPWRQSLVQMRDEFHDVHQRHYGFSDTARNVEIVTVRLRVVTPAETWQPPLQEEILRDCSVAISSVRPVRFNGEWHDTSIYDRTHLRAGDSLAGPAVITEYSSTTVVPPGDILTVDRLGNLVIEVAA